MSLPTYPTRKDQQWFYLCIFRMLLGLNFAVIENCTFRNVEGPVLTGCTGPSTFWNVQFSNSVIYLLHICIIVHILSVFVYREEEKKNRHWSLRRGRVWKIDPSGFEIPARGLYKPTFSSIISIQFLALWLLLL